MKFELRGEQAISHRARKPDDSTSSEPEAWHLDPLVAEQKQRVHLELLGLWGSQVIPLRALKTDLYEEATGRATLLPHAQEVCPARIGWFGMDIVFPTTRRARVALGRSVRILVTDLRQLAFRDGSFDLILSNSSLDHFDDRRDFERAVEELARVLAPGGTIILTVDNTLNPTYWLLRVASRLRLTPFSLGYAPRIDQLVRMVESCGLQVTGHCTLIHNPRGFSVIFFAAIRKLFGSLAPALIQWWLDCFALLERLPTRWITACFVGIKAVKPRDVSPSRTHLTHSLNIDSR